MSKSVHPLRKAGWEMVKIPSHMLDSIWQKDNMLHIRFATGQSCTFGELTESTEEEITIPAKNLDNQPEDIILKAVRFGSKYPNQIDKTSEPVVEAVKYINTLLEAEKEHGYNEGWNAYNEAPYNSRPANQEIQTVLNRLRELPAMQSEWEQDIHGCENRNGVAKNSLRAEIHQAIEAELKKIGEK